MSSEVYTDIDTAVITFAVSFSSSFTGMMQDHMYIVDNLGMDHRDTQSDGTWTWNVGTYPLLTISGMSTVRGPRSSAESA
jgi:hypothetical protein